MSQDQSFIGILQSVPMLRQLSERECEALAMGMRICRYSGGETLFHEGKPGDSLIIVADGLLKVSVKGPDGSEKQVSKVRSGEVVGDMSCIDPAPRSATVTAITDALCFELSRTMLQALQNNAPAVASAIVGAVIKHVTTRVRDTNVLIGEELKARGIGTGELPGSLKGPAEVSVSGQEKARVDLRKVPSLRAFSNEELKRLVQVAPPRTYPAGTVLCQENAMGTSCFILARGQVEVLKKMEGAEKSLATLDVGAMVGQMSLVDNSPRSATVKALGDLVALKLERSAFEDLVAGQDPLGIRFQEQIAIAGIRQLRIANGRFSALIKKDLERGRSVGARPLPKPEIVAPHPRTRPATRPAPTQARAEPTSRPTGRPEALANTLRSQAAQKERENAPDGAQARMQLRKPGSPKPPPHRKPEKPSRPAPRRRSSPKGEQDVDKLTFAYLQTALQEWDMSINEIDKISVVKADGVVSQDEMKARGGRIV